MTSASAQTQPPTSAPKTSAPTAVTAPGQPAAPQKPGSQPPKTTPPPKAAPPPQAPATTPRPAAARAPAFHVNAFGMLGYQQFAAKKSFGAIFGNSGKSVLGGGAQVWHRSGLFAQMEYSRYQDEGQRVFVNDGMIFPLGIPLRLELGFLDVSAGYKFVRRVRTPRPPAPKKPVAPQPARRNDEAATWWQATPAKPAAPPTAPPRTTPARRPSTFRMTPYVGGGLGRVSYRETSDFSQSGDNIDESHPSYHVFGGIETPVWKWLGINVEGAYRWVPDALGEGGVAAEYGEKDLGGIAFRVKFTVGR